MQRALLIGGSCTPPPCHTGCSAPRMRLALHAACCMLRCAGYSLACSQPVTMTMTMAMGPHGPPLGTCAHIMCAAHACASAQS